MSINNVIITLLLINRRKPGELKMKIDNKEIQDINKLAKRLILNLVSELEDDIHQTTFGNMDIETEQARKFLKHQKGIELSHVEAILLVKNIKFELAKIESVLKKQLGEQEISKYPTRSMFGIN
tara:strand:+ start:63 stop:434 length:372 start_codon:yes stop_codon:yes gene_type:complete